MVRHDSHFWHLTCICSPSTLTPLTDYTHTPKLQNNIHITPHFYTGNMIPPTASIKSFLLQASFLACCSEALRFPLPEQRILHTSSSPPQPPHENALPKQDCTIRCPPASPDGGKIVLPALTQTRNSTGQWENTLECWAVDTVETEVPGIDNAFQLQWEGGFDAAYQYVFYGPSFMPPHPAPEPSLIVMGSGIGEFSFSVSLIQYKLLLAHRC